MSLIAEDISVNEAATSAAQSGSTARAGARSTEKKTVVPRTDTIADDAEDTESEKAADIGFLTAVIPFSVLSALPASSGKPPG